MAAKSKALTIREADVLRLEGIAQKLVEMKPADRPKTEAYAYIGQQLGIARSTVRDWVRQIRPMTRRKDTAAAFFDVYERIAELLSENLETRVWDMTAPGGRDAFRAAAWLLPRVNPERFDPTVQNVETADDDVFSTAGVPQEVFDSMSDERRERIAGYRQKMLELMEAYELELQEAAAELMAQDLAERRHDA